MTDKPKIAFGMHAPLADHHTGHAVPGNVARDGVAKRHTATEFHPGMSHRQQNAAGFGGMGHPTAHAPDSSSSNPLAPTNPGKVRTPAKAVVGHRSRIHPLEAVAGLPPGVAHAVGAALGVDHDLGAAVLAEAHCHADDQRALASRGIGTRALPRNSKGC